MSFDVRFGYKKFYLLSAPKRYTFTPHRFREHSDVVTDVKESEDD